MQFKTGTPCYHSKSLLTLTFLLFTLDILSLTFVAAKVADDKFSWFTVP